MDSIEGKVAVVTGGASGIGRATVHRLVEDGATVVVADIDEEQGRQVAAEIGGSFVATDVTDPEAWQRLVGTTTDQHRRLDIAFLNAGVMTRPPDAAGDNGIDDLTDDAYRRIMAINVDGVVFGARAVVPGMRAVGGGAIVVTSSLAGLIGFPPDPLYSVTKHAVIGLVRSLAPQLEPSGITVNAVCPGIVDTPLLGETAKETLRKLEFPLIPPSDIAAAVVHAITSGETGQAFVCQAGREPVRYEFRQVPGPRAEGAEGMRPPEAFEGSTSGGQTQS
jgi:NAD(P)-dependent dehydrogenase (short-subunit alcohol dehydrogenase family)